MEAVFQFLASLKTNSWQLSITEMADEKYHKSSIKPFPSLLSPHVCLSVHSGSRWNFQTSGIWPLWEVPHWPFALAFCCGCRCRCNLSCHAALEATSLAGCPSLNITPRCSIHLNNQLVVSGCVQWTCEYAGRECITVVVLHFNFRSTICF